MVKVFEGTEQEYYMDGYLKENLDTAKKVIKQDWDMVFLVDGFEGCGKSVLAQQVAKYCDNSIDIDRITFTPKQFKDAVLDAKAYQAVIFDEAYGALNAKTAMQWVNRSIVKMMTEIRQKNLFIVIVLPTFFDLVKYIAIWRSRALIHVYSGDDFERGFFCFYNIDRKKSLYVNGKKFYNYNNPKPNFFGRFTDGYTIDINEYKKKKLISTTKEEDEYERKLRKAVSELRSNIAAKIHLDKFGLTQTEIGELLGVSRMTIHRYLQKEEIDDVIEEDSGFS